MRLIDQDAMMKRFEQEVQLMFGETVTIKEIRRFLGTRPTIDAAPVVHGEWLELCGSKMRMCSCCEHCFDSTCNDIDGEWAFCPNCGARMDKEDANEANG